MAIWGATCDLWGFMGRDEARRGASSLHGSRYSSMLVPAAASPGCPVSTALASQPLKLMGRQSSVRRLTSTRVESRWKLGTEINSTLWPAEPGTQGSRRVTGVRVQTAGSGSASTPVTVVVLNAGWLPTKKTCGVASSTKGSRSWNG